MTVRRGESEGKRASRNREPIGRVHLRAETPRGSRPLVRCEVENFNLSLKGASRDCSSLWTATALVARPVKVGQVIEVTIRPEPPSPKGEAVHPVYKLVSLDGVEAGGWSRVAKGSRPRRGSARLRG